MKYCMTVINIHSRAYIIMPISTEDDKTRFKLMEQYHETVARSGALRNDTNE